MTSLTPAYEDVSLDRTQRLLVYVPLDHLTDLLIWHRIWRPF